MKKWIAVLVIGCILALGPIWGVIGTILGMTQAFGHLAESDSQTEALASDIGLALYTTAAGYIMCPIGIVLIVIAAIKVSKAGKQKQAAEAAQQEN